MAVIVKRLALLALSLGLSGCYMAGPDYKEPKLNITKSWPYASRKNDAAVKEAQHKTANWWKRFNDKNLNALIEKGYEQNLDLQITGINLLYQRASLAKAVGELYPQQQNILSNYSYNRIGASSLENILPNNFYTASAGLSANWELDFWGKYRRAIQANDANFLGSQASYDNALVSLISNIAQTYIDIRVEEALVDVTKENIRSQKESSHIASERFRLGQTSQLDVEEAYTQLGQTQSRLPGQLSSLQAKKNELALLLGLTPNEINPLLKKGYTIPKAPKQIEVGFPKEILGQRPDVEEAKLNAIAKLATLGQTVSELYPAFSLGGSFTFSSNSIGNSSVNDLFTWSKRQVVAGPSLLMPIFNYGQIRNSIRMQDALYQQALMSYQNVVLTAQKEVASAISDYIYAKKSAQILAKTVKHARLSTSLSLVRYQNGETGYNSVLDAQREQLSVESNLVRAKGKIATSMATLFSAVGGGWQIRAGNDVISQAVKEQMAQRTNWGGLLKAKNHLPALVNEKPLSQKLLPTW